MHRFIFVSLYLVLLQSTVPVSGQFLVPSCAVSVSGSEERLQVSLDEHDHRLETMNQNIYSAFEKLEAAVNRTNARGQEELCQDLTKMYYNMSANLDRVSEKIPDRFMCHTKHEQEEYLSSMNVSLTSMIVKSDKSIQALNENLINVYKNLSSTLQSVNRGTDVNFQLIKVQLQSQSSELKNQSSALQTASRNFDYKIQLLNETLSSSIDKINEKLNAILNQVSETIQYTRSQDHCRSTSVVCDCSDIKVNGYTTSGVYRIYVVDQGQRYYTNVFCDMTTTNGSWTVFQRRRDGSVDFYREWNEYENGFGNPNGEFWLGNNFLHLLTSKRRYRLRIDLEDFEGGKRYAEYSIFNISSSADKYRLRIGNYSGNAGDCLMLHNGLRFSTKDNDNYAISAQNYAVTFHGAWWFYSSYQSNLNGLYLRGPYTIRCPTKCYEGITWISWRGWTYSLKTTDMKISPS